MTFETWLEKNFKVDKNGDLKRIRGGCFNGNGLLMNVTKDDLEEAWEMGKASLLAIDEEVTDNANACIPDDGYREGIGESGL